MSFCAYAPVPMRVVAHLLGQNPDINSPVMQNVRDGVLLQTSKTKIDEEPIEVVSLHQTTWQLLCDKLLITVTNDHGMTPSVACSGKNIIKCTCSTPQEPDRAATRFSDVHDVTYIFQEVTAAFVAQQNMVRNVKYYENLQPHLESLRVSSSNMHNLYTTIA